MILVSCKGSISLLRAWQCWGTWAEHSLSSCSLSRVTRAGQAPPEDFPELSVAHSYSKSEGSLSASCRSTPGRRISHGKSYFCYYLPSSASFCLEVLSAVLPVNKSTFPKGAFSRDSPFHSARDTLRSNSFFYLMTPSFTYTSCMIVLMTMLFFPSPFCLSFFLSGKYILA